MQLLHIEVWIGDRWQRVLRLDGKREFWPPKDGDTDDRQSQELEEFLKDHPETFWVETTASPHGVYVGPGVPRLFRFVPAG
ncbi:hypothetical protein [Streptomyces lanatus]|uniref:Uncharacterized protein n=1 Tax=Streptomyces lanatus TaxID=66900 RepID=A0ABV1XKH6_9ACTN|nr:hypothetical protein [Streptomyces lanatus]GHG96819.1 hypothetical protein GCM10018780_21660 [Streptomyces lanatus]